MRAASRPEHGGAQLFARPAHRPPRYNKVPLRIAAAMLK